ncbi:MAG: hypothetical protein RL354_2575 [Planctomycetota bacterium]|jgi:hypothetical protein
MSQAPLDGAEWSALAHAVLDGVATESEMASFSAVIAAHPERARDFARLALLHDAIERASAAGADGRAAARRHRVVTFTRRVALLAASIAIAAGAAWLAVGTGRTASADEIIARIADVARAGDRTYFLRAIGVTKAVPEPRRSGRPQPPIDGAILSLRAPGSYVLARLDEHGDEYLSGSDGVTSWVVPARGPVRVSRDTARFRGALPGSQHAIAFIDPHGDLSTLAASYDLRTISASASDRLARIVGTRRSDARGGPKRIEIAYDPATSVIQAIRMENLPQGRGGPRSIEFELVDDAPLDAAYFTHRFHHGADRAVIEERD